MERLPAWVALAVSGLVMGACASTAAPTREPEPPAGVVGTSLLVAHEDRIAAHLATLDPAVLDLSRRASPIAWSC